MGGLSFSRVSGGRGCPPGGGGVSPVSGGWVAPGLALRSPGGCQPLREPLHLRRQACVGSRGSADARATRGQAGQDGASFGTKLWVWTNVVRGFGVPGLWALFAKAQRTMGQPPPGCKSRARSHLLRASLFIFAHMWILGALPHSPNVAIRTWAVEVYPPNQGGPDINSL